MKQRYDTHEDLKRLLRQDPEYRKQERLQRPYFDLVLAIVKRRITLGMSQKDLAEKAGTYQSRISKIESAEHDIRLSTLTQIAEALGTQVVIQLIPFPDTYQNDNDSAYHQLFQARTRTTTCIEPSKATGQNAINFSASNS